MSKQNEYKYSLNFSPKNELKKFIESAKLKILSFKDGSEKSTNKLIQGDGLDVLSSLKIGIGQDNEFLADIIMIDPPYNEGKSAGKYKDQWKGSGKNFDWAGESHGSYLDFLHPRLVMGKNVLSKEGMIMVFIGDREYHYVRTLMEQIFGEGNYLGTIIWDSSSNQQKSKKIDRNHEYVIMFCKNENYFPGLYKTENASIPNQLNNKALSLKGMNFNDAQKQYLDFFNEIKKDSNSTFKYILPNEYIPFYLDNAGAPDSKNRPNTKLIHPITKKECPIPGNGKGWRFSQEYLNQISNSDNIHVLYDGRVLVYESHPTSPDLKGLVFGKDETGVPNTCRIYSHKTDKKVLKTTGYSFKGDKKEGVDSKTGFETIKPKEFLTELILNYPKKNAVILDYFAGSGTTAVAVADANKIDQGQRSWILVEINQNTIKDVLIPKLNFFGIKKDDYKHLEIKECAIDNGKLENYFSKFLISYLRSSNQLNMIEDSIHLAGIDVIGVNEKNKSLLITNIQIEGQNLIPSKTVDEIKRVIDETNCVKLDIYIVGDETFDATWDMILKLIVKNKILSSKDIVLNKIPEKIIQEWENMMNQLSGEQE